MVKLSHGSNSDAQSNAQGHPVHILEKNAESGIYELQTDNLKNLLLAPEVKDKHVCVLAVAGAFRTGKSFLLDFLLRYCANRVSSWALSGIRNLQF